MNFLYNYIKSSIICVSIFFATMLAQETYICVWTNPERTMTRIFADAKDYKTITKKITKEQREKIEKKLGSILLPGQRESFQYYELLNAKGATLGHIIGASQKGEYGAIEFVFGIDKENKIKAIYIQRAREKDTEFKKVEFLKQFIGKTMKDMEKVELGKDIKAKNTIGTKAVVLGIRKELITLDILTTPEQEDSINPARKDVLPNK